MKNTKTNVVKLLKELQYEVKQIAQLHKALGDKAGYEHNKGRYLAYGLAIDLIADEFYFNYVNDVFKKKG